MDLSVRPISSFGIYRIIYCERERIYHLQVQMGFVFLKICQKWIILALERVHLRLLVKKNPQK